MTNEQITQQVTDMQARLNNCAQTGRPYRATWHEIKSLITTVTTLQARLAEAHDFNNDVVEREAAVCPEDVSFDEYIRALEKKLTTARADAIRKCAEAAKQKAEEYRGTAERYAEHAKRETLPEAKTIDEDSSAQCFAKCGAMIVFAAALELLANQEEEDGPASGTGIL